MSGSTSVAQRWQSRVTEFVELRVAGKLRKAWRIEQTASQTFTPESSDAAPYESGYTGQVFYAPGLRMIVRKEIKYFQHAEGFTGGTDGQLTVEELKSGPGI